jgi:hypothetical protein
MMKFPKALVLAVVFIAGCAGVPEQQQRLAAKVKVTASIHEMQFHPLRLSENHGITLDAEQPAFEFAEGKSYYAARAIPLAQPARMLSFKTYLSTQYLPQANVLLPHFLFLDDAKRSVGLVKTFPLKRATDFWRGVYFEGEIAIPATASYFVLFTSNDENPKLSSVSENGHVRLVPHAPVGTVDVKVLPSH